MAKRGQTSRQASGEKPGTQDKGPLPTGRQPTLARRNSCKDGPPEPEGKEGSPQKTDAD